MSIFRTPKSRRGLAVAAVAALAATGCGSSLSHEEMLQANSEAFRLTADPAATDSRGTPAPAATPELTTNASATPGAGAADDEDPPHSPARSQASLARRAAFSRAKSSPAWCEERVSGVDDTSRKPLA